MDQSGKPHTPDQGPFDDDSHFLEENSLHEDVLALQDEIRLKLTSIRGGAMKGYRTRMLKAGPFKHRPLSISDPEQFLSPNPYIRSADELAHLFTTHQDAWSPSLFDAVQHLIALPELAISHSGLLTHIYDPQTKILAFYSYPARFHLNISNAPGARFAALHRNSPGILGSVGASIVEAYASYKKNVSFEQSSIHTYALSTEILDPEEIREMEQIEELRIGNKNYDVRVY